MRGRRRLPTSSLGRPRAARGDDSGQLRLRRLPWRSPEVEVRETTISHPTVVVYVVPRCHFVQYPLRRAATCSPGRRLGRQGQGGLGGLVGAESRSRSPRATENLQRGCRLMGRASLLAHVRRTRLTWVYGDALLGGRGAPAASIHRQWRDHGPSRTARPRRAPGRESWRLDNALACYRPSAPTLSAGRHGVPDWGTPVALRR